MKLRAFGIELTIQKSNTPESVKAHLLSKLEANALMGLEGARIELAVKRELLAKKEEHGRNESEIKGMENAVEIEQKTIYNYQTQLDVMNNLDKYEREQESSEESTEDESGTSTGTGGATEDEVHNRPTRARIYSRV